MAERLKPEDFSPYLNQKFRIFDESGELLEAELIGVSRKMKKKPFSLILLGPKNKILPQKIYRFDVLIRLNYLPLVIAVVSVRPIIPGYECPSLPWPCFHQQATITV